MYSIYRIRNITNNKVYIGQTSKAVETRLVQHIYQKSAIGLDIREYGILKFVIDTVDIAETREKAYELERQWVEKYKDNTYNVMPGGANNKAYMNLLSTLPRRKRGKAKHYKPGDDISHLRGKRRKKAIEEIESQTPKFKGVVTFKCYGWQASYNI